MEKLIINFSAGILTNLNPDDIVMSLFFQQSSKSINSVAFVDHPHEENIAVLSGGNKGILDLWSLEGSEISR